ncbi:MAG TPA: hypothetical protein VN603_08890, partial [Candidatus Acidoferrales bacterium]|nr:hypothetical protein [Candidatus Acidoferrales bacterium]
GGGLGEYVVNGLANNDTGSLLEGAVSVALLALATEYGLAAVGRRLGRSKVGDDGLEPKDIL